MAWTEEQLRDYQRTKTQVAQKATPVSKYRNVRTNIRGEIFDSRREADHWLVLKAQEESGEISGLQRQVIFPLYAPEMVNEYATGTIAQVSEYRADYVYRDNTGTLHVVDAKGHRTKEYQRSKKWLFVQSGIEIEEV